MSGIESYPVHRKNLLRDVALHRLSKGRVPIYVCMHMERYLLFEVQKPCRASRMSDSAA